MPLPSPPAMTSHESMGGAINDSLHKLPWRDSKDDILTSSLIFMAGLGFLFALLNLFISGFGPEDIWRSFIAAAISLILLAFRRLIIQSSQNPNP